MRFALGRVRFYSRCIEVNPVLNDLFPLDAEDVRTLEYHGRSIPLPWFCLRVAEPGYSQRKTFAESAVQTTNTRTNAAMSPTCADQASPSQIPRSRDTA